MRNLLNFILDVNNIQRQNQQWTEPSSKSCLQLPNPAAVCHIRIFIIFVQSTTKLCVSTYCILNKGSMLKSSNQPTLDIADMILQLWTISSLVMTFSAETFILPSSPQGMNTHMYITGQLSAIIFQVMLNLGYHRAVFVSHLEKACVRLSWDGRYSVVGIHLWHVTLLTDWPFDVNKWFSTSLGFCPGQAWLDNQWTPLKQRASALYRWAGKDN